jgi:hypothetical protein
MRRVLLLLLFILILSISFSGCSVLQKSLQEPGDVIINESSVLALVQDAVIRFWHVSGGGEITNTGLESFTYNNMDYRYLGDDINTKEKLDSYLGKVYSKEAIDLYVKAAGIIEYDGKIAQPNADGGDLRMWESAAVVKIENKDTKKDCTIKVPYPDDAGMEPELVIITIEKSQEGNWVISNTPGSF